MGTSSKDEERWNLPRSNLKCFSTGTILNSFFASFKGELALQPYIEHHYRIVGGRLVSTTRPRLVGLVLIALEALRSAPGIICLLLKDVAQTLDLGEQIRLADSQRP
jgi:hypothetical protein